MSFKNKHYWLKGGIIASSILIFITIIGQLFWSNGGNKLLLVNLPGALLLILFDGLFFGGTFKSPTYSELTGIILSIFLSLLIYFGVGSIIGLIIGKIKSKK